MRTYILRSLLAFAMVTTIPVEGLPGPAGARTDPLDLHQTESQAIAIYRKTQQAEDRWAEQKTAMQKRYQALQAEEKVLETQHTRLQAQVDALQARRAEAERTVAEAGRVAEELQAHLDTLVVRLEEFIALDLPFLPVERTERMADLKRMLAQPGTNIAEKSRRIMEAMKIETEYGQTVEVYQETIRIGGPGDNRAIMADILRVGRLALLWRSPDGKTVGQWDRAGAKWDLLPDTCRRPINDAVEMALKRRTIDMVKLPLGRISHQ